MMRLLLTSDFPSTVSDIVIAHMRSVAADPRIAWIPPFADVGRGRFTLARQQFQALGFHQLEYCDIDAELDENLLSHLGQYDIVYLSGGDPNRFRVNILRSGLHARLKGFVEGGGLLVAASGGSMQLTQNLSLYRLRSASVDEVFEDRHEYQALGFVPYELLPHLNRLVPEFMEKVRRYSERVEHDILAISDGSAVFHKDRENYQIAGSVVTFRAGAMTA